MAAAATLVRERDDIRANAPAAMISGELHQLKDGRAGFKKGLAAAASGDAVAYQTTGQVVLPKTASIVLLDGGRAYWDRSASAVHFKKVNDRDFYLGRIVGDAASADTTCTVNLNVDPQYDLDIMRQPVLSALAGTAAAGGFGYPVRLGDCHILELTATNEAQKVDLLSVDGFAIGANAIIEGQFRVISDGASTAVDFNIGVANGTHATDADAITESCFLHLDENVTTILAQSTGSGSETDIAAVTTTKTYTEGSTVACRKEFWIDMRSEADIQIYIDGVLVLGSTVFDLSSSTGPLFLLAHVEKTSSTDTYKVAIDALRARFAEQ